MTLYDASSIYGRIARRARNAYKLNKRHKASLQVGLGLRLATGFQC
jgi:hypothetical protein